MKIVFAAFILAAGLMQAVAFADGNTGIIRGIVRQYDTEKPLKNAYVIWVSPVGFGSTQSDANGRFYFLSVPPGITFIQVRGSGYHPSCIKGVVHPNETIDAAVVHLDTSMPGQIGVIRCTTLHFAGREAVEDALQR